MYKLLYKILILQMSIIKALFRKRSKIVMENILLKQQLEAYKKSNEKANISDFDRSIFMTLLIKSDLNEKLEVWAEKCLKFWVISVDIAMNFKHFFCHRSDFVVISYLINRVIYNLLKVPGHGSPKIVFFVKVRTTAGSTSEAKCHWENDKCE